MTGRREGLLLFVSLLLGTCLSAQTITEFPLARGSHPYGIAAGLDGNIWFAEYEFFAGIPKIVRMTPTGDRTEFPQGLDTNFIAPGPDGNLWFTADDVGGFTQNAVIGRIPLRGGGLTDGGLANIPVGSGLDLHDITGGPDGNVWFSWSTIGYPRLGVSRVTLAGVVTDFFIGDVSSPGGIAAGPDGAIWFTVPGAARIGRITPAGDISGFALPLESRPVGIVAGPDGNLWFTNQSSSGHSIGRMTPQGVVTEFRTPTIGSEPQFIAAGPDGNLWFTERAGNRIGRITTVGIITEFMVPTRDSQPYDITTGPDGAIWFTENLAGRIGRLDPTTEEALDSRIIPVVGSTAGVGGSFFRTAVQLHNPTSAAMTGRVIFHPSGATGANSDPVIHYSLSPGETRSIDDLLPEMGQAGLGSADIEVTAGEVPVTTVRVFNDAGAQGTTGFTEEPMRGEDALRPAQSGVLLLPPDLTRFRFNLGVRTLTAESIATLTLRDASGAVLETVSRTFPATYHEQRSADEFLGISTLPAGGSIGISMTSGSAVFYGATVDNTTGDPSFQVARPAPQR